MSFSDEINTAIEKAQGFLLDAQDQQEGFWVGELQADSTLTSEYIMLRRFLGKVDPVKEKKAVTYLISSQCPEGGWPIYFGGESEISASVKAYFALKLAGVSPDEPFMKRAREAILAQGGVVRANVFTKIALALFGQFEWRGIPSMPPELIFLPPGFFFSFYDVSYWSRTVIIPLLIVLHARPLCQIPKSASISELYLEPRERTGHLLEKETRWLSWKNLFVTLDRLFKLYDKYPVRPLRRKAVEKAHAWVVEHMRGAGGLGAIYPAMANSIIALRTLGYEVDHPLVKKALQEIEALEIEDDTSLHLQPCVSPVWDTALSLNALIESGLPRDHPALVKAGCWLMTKQAREKGDWAIKVPSVEPGGWYFQFENEFYPDNDDTAAVLMALQRVTLPDEEEKMRSINRGLNWLLAMQSTDGGWGSFDVDNNKLFLNNIPFADHGALVDPSTCDVTGRVLELLGSLGYDKSFPPARSALAFIRKNQEANGSWYGRWGVNYIYGTWSVLTALKMIGEDMGEGYVRRAVAWLKDRQNKDGGWGESCYSYSDPATAGVGKSTPSQTAWAILGLCAAGEVTSPAVENGIRFLLRLQQPDGSWEEEEFTGTGFPRVFYLRYHMYRQYFPQWALSTYRSLMTKGRTRAEEIKMRSLSREERRGREWEKE